MICLNDVQTHDRLLCSYLCLLTELCSAQMQYTERQEEGFLRTDLCARSKSGNFLAYFLIKRTKCYSAEFYASAEWLKLLRHFLQKALVFVY